MQTHLRIPLLLTVFLLGILLAGCTAQPTVSPSATLLPPTPTQLTPGATLTPILPTVTPLPTETAVPSATPSTPKPTHQIATATGTRLPPTVTTKPNDRVNFLQLQAVSSLPESAKIPGSIVIAELWEVHSYYDSDARQITIWDLGTNLQHNLLSGEERVEDISVSPDGQWLKYTKKKLSETDNWFYPASLHIVSVEGQEQKTLPWINEWGVISQWLDNENLIIRRNAVGGDPYRISFTAKWVLNPFTETVSELPEDPEDIYDLFPKPDWSGIGMVSYNSDLAFRVYLSRNSHLILEDMNTHQVLDVLPEHYRNSTPCWSPNGQEFAVAATLEGYDERNVPFHFELYRVSVDGTVTRLTDMTEYFEYYSIQNCTWSPDGREIAFWINTTESYPNIYTGRANLAIADVDKGNVTIYSLESYTEQKIVWSPDGQWLLTGIVQPDYQDVSTVLIDLTEGWYAQIADHMTPMGWMTSP